MRQTPPKQEALMAIFATPNEVIALGDTIYTYVRYLRSRSHITDEQRTTADLLESFQRRLATQVQRSSDPASGSYEEDG